MFQIPSTPWAPTCRPMGRERSGSTESWRDRLPRQSGAAAGGHVRASRSSLVHHFAVGVSARAAAWTAIDRRSSPEQRPVQRGIRLFSVQIQHGRTSMIPHSECLRRRCQPTWHRVSLQRLRRPPWFSLCDNLAPVSSAAAGHGNGMDGGIVRAPPCRPSRRAQHTEAFGRRRLRPQLSQHTRCTNHRRGRGRKLR